MPFKKIDTKEMADQLGINWKEVREKQRLIEQIIKIRKSKGMSQATLGKKMGITQSRIAQIESGVGTAKVTFDILFGILDALGFTLKIQVKKVA